MYWNYRVVVKDGNYSICEVYYDDDGHIEASTEEPVGPSGDRRAVVLAWPSAVGVRVPAQASGLSQLDRTVVEGPPLAGAQGPAVRDLGGGLRGDSGGNRLLEPTSSSFHLGTAPSAPPPSETRGRSANNSGIDLPDAPLSGSSGKYLVVGILLYRRASDYGGARCRHMFER